ncbi:MAG: alpha/beta hydrolase [Pseudomonadota bacterium]
MVLVNIARNPVPAGAVSGHFRGYDGVKLRFARWQSTSEKRNGTVCVFTGRSEFIEKYFEVISDLRMRGFAVTIMDWRGQGGSHRELRNPRKGHINSFSEYQKDVHCYMREVVLPDCPPPYFTLAHSMGAQIMIHMLTSQSSWFERAVLVSPMFHLMPTLLPLSQGTITYLTEILSFLGVGEYYVPSGRDETWDEQPFEGNIITSDKTRYKRAQAILEIAPELGLGSPTIGWLRAACRSMAKLEKVEFPTQIQVPTLIIGAGADRIVLTRFAEDFSLRLKIGSHVTIPGAQHEIMQERDELRLQFWAAFDAYIPGGRDLPLKETSMV